MHEGQFENILEHQNYINQVAALQELSNILSITIEIFHSEIVLIFCIERMLEVLRRHKRRAVQNSNLSQLSPAAVANFMHACTTPCASPIILRTNSQASLYVFTKP